MSATAHMFFFKKKKVNLLGHIIRVHHDIKIPSVFDIEIYKHVAQHPKSCLDDIATWATQEFYLVRSLDITAISRILKRKESVARVLLVVDKEDIKAANCHFQCKITDSLPLLKYKYCRAKSSH